MGYIVVLENAYIKQALAKCNRNDLTVIDTSIVASSIVRQAVDKGVHVYGYLNLIS